METKKTRAVLVQAGQVVAQTYTTARAGDTVSYGWERAGGAIHAVGRARVSRAKRYLNDNELMLSLEDKVALVNRGGGEPI